VDYATHIAAIWENVDLLVDAADEAGLAAPVPSCPGWTVDDLLVHVASEADTRIVRSRSTDRPDVSWFTASPQPGDRFQRARNHGYDLADALAETPEDTPVWTFAGSGITAYRIAHDNSELEAFGDRALLERWQRTSRI
jgi:Mycothiol maleylpyruvate isomerase N-terminal domain